LTRQFEFEVDSMASLWLFEILNLTVLHYEEVFYYCSRIPYAVEHVNTRKFRSVKNSIGLRIDSMVRTLERLSQIRPQHSIDYIYGKAVRPID
jgi:hypothetical protein